MVVLTVKVLKSNGEEKVWAYTFNTLQQAKNIYGKIFIKYGQAPGVKGLLMNIERVEA